jgi:hypothetical protein
VGTKGETVKVRAKSSGKSSKPSGTIVGRVTALTQEEVKKMVLDPVEEARPILEYLAAWRADSLRSNFRFG